MDKDGVKLHLENILSLGISLYIKDKLTLFSLSVSTD
jgi:hypothetical protein